MTSFGEAVRLALASGRGLLLARVALTLLAGATPVAIAWLTKIVLDRLITPDRPLLTPVLMLAAAGIAAVVLPHLLQYAEAQMQRAVDLAARSRLYAAVARMPGLRRLENPVFQDRLALAGETGATGPSEVVAAGLAAVQGLVLLTGFVITLAVLNAWMLLPILVAAAVALDGQVRLSRFRARLHGELGHATRREMFYAQLLNSPAAAKEVRLYGLGGLFAGRMVAELRWAHTHRRRMDRRELLVQAMHALAATVMAGGGLVWAVHAARDGHLTIGDVTVFVAALAGVQDGLTVLISSVGRMHEALLLFGHYRHVVESGPDLPPPRPGARVTPLEHGIEIRDVWFRYGADLPWVLRGVTLRIPAGQAVALVGSNGCGKSTLVKLLCRFYDPDRGAILWDGVDLRDLPVDDLRQRIGTVFQDYMAYELSAADNIGLGDLPAPDNLTAQGDLSLGDLSLGDLSLGDLSSPGCRGRVVAAARRAGIDPVLAALPRGYDTMLSRAFDNPAYDDPGTGVLLSGGQWQRVALARALLRDRADLLILDEPNAGLDAEAEHEVHRLLNEHRAGRTSLLISHRLSTVRDAGTIVVLTGGTVTEQGTHEGLLATGGRYAEMFRLQAEGYRTGGTHPAGAGNR